MTRRSRGITVVIQRDGMTRSQTVRLSLWTIRLVLLGGVCLLAGLGLLAVLYLPIVRAAARVPGLERQVARLTSDNAKVRQLSIELDSVEMRYAQLRQMIGADIVRDPLALSSSLPLAPPVQARVADAPRPPGPGPTVPREWPLDEAGYVTRGQVGTGTQEEAHPGLDIAVPVGTLVRAAGGASVTQVGEDPEYGEFVLLTHPEEYQTMYGHLSRIIVTAGQEVEAGQVIGLSGNSGRSTAPHLHFEIRQRGSSLDPRTMVKQGGMGIFSNPARDEEGNELRRRKTDQIPFSIIASDMTVIGDLETEGIVRIEGRVKGTVRVGAQVLVSSGAVIEGDLHTQEAVIAGQVSGGIRATDRVELQGPPSSPATSTPRASRLWKAPR